eukprot:756469-Hanusia_phi.AAC.1
MQRGRGGYRESDGRQAHWCPQCRSFDPELKKFYETVNGGGEKRLHVHAEESEEATAVTHKSYHGDWLAGWRRERRGREMMECVAVPFSSPIRNELKRKFGVCAGREQGAVGVSTRRNGIPTLLGEVEEACQDRVDVLAVLKEDGSELTIDGASGISSGRGTRMQEGKDFRRMVEGVEGVKTRGGEMVQTLSEYGDDEDDNNHALNIKS